MDARSYQHEHVTLPDRHNRLSAAGWSIDRPWSLPDTPQRQVVQQQPQRPWALPPDALVSTATSSSSLASAATSGSSAGISAAAPAQDALHIYSHGLDDHAVAAAVDAMKLGEALWLTERIHDADAILALRSKVKQVGIYQCRSPHEAAKVQQHTRLHQASVHHCMPGLSCFTFEHCRCTGRLGAHSRKAGGHPRVCGQERRSLKPGEGTAHAAGHRPLRRRRTARRRAGG